MSLLRYIRRAQLHGGAASDRRATQSSPDKPARRRHLTLSVLVAVGLIAVGAYGTASLLGSSSSTSFNASNLLAGFRITARPPLKRADFRDEQPAREVRSVADWVVDSADSGGLPFVLLDKTNAKVFAFSASGKLLGAAPVLLGAAHGDESVPGIGERKISEIRPEERTTPAGRFVAALGRNTNGEDILWVDYDAAVSLHRLRANDPAERRWERLASETAGDNRISYGCINVPPHFYDTVISPTFSKGSGIVYVLPETRAARLVFGSYDVDARQHKLNSFSGMLAWARQLVK